MDVRELLLWVMLGVMHSSLDSVGLAFFWCFRKEILGCQKQAVWPTLESSLLARV